MAKDGFNQYNPDVLSTLSNLSNDEVFTPPKVVNQILDILPQEVFKDKNTKFLDPSSKSGVFLREIAKRLIDGLESQIPDLQNRIDHVLHNQLFGISITEMTSLISRRTLYCSKYPNSRYSISYFNNPKGNIDFQRSEHIWIYNKCSVCGAKKDQYDRGLELDNHAYQFLHSDLEEYKNMKFDVIIGNPPYQLSDGGAQSSAIPLYHKFVIQAKKLNPRYLTMIIPSRWFNGGKGLDSFRDEMLNDKSIRVLHDFLDASECFPNVRIKGGVCYFLWDRDNKGLCKITTHKKNQVISISERPLLEENIDVFIRYNEGISILKKVNKFKEAKFNRLVSSRKPFGLATDFKEFSDEYFQNSYKLHSNKKIGYVKQKLVQSNSELIEKHKLFIPYAIGSGEIDSDWLNPIMGYPNDVCTETYLVIGPFENEKTTKNVFTYTQTKFFHFLLGLRKSTQHTTSKVYSFIPLQDFDAEWSDEELYKKYGLDKNEINFIEYIFQSKSKLDSV